MTTSGLLLLAIPASRFNSYATKQNVTTLLRALLKAFYRNDGFVVIVFVIVSDFVLGICMRTCACVYDCIHAHSRTGNWTIRRRIMQGKPFPVHVQPSGIVYKPPACKYKLKLYTSRNCEYKPYTSRNCKYKPPGSYTSRIQATWGHIISLPRRGGVRRVMIWIDTLPLKNTLLA